MLALILFTGGNSKARYSNQPKLSYKMHAQLSHNDKLQSAAGDDIKYLQETMFDMPGPEQCGSLHPIFKQRKTTSTVSNQSTRYSSQDVIDEQTGNKLITIDEEIDGFNANTINSPFEFRKNKLKQHMSLSSSTAHQNKSSTVYSGKFPSTTTNANSFFMNNGTQSETSNAHSSFRNNATQSATGNAHLSFKKNAIQSATTDVQSSLPNNGTQLATDVQSSLTNNGTQLATDVQSFLTNNGTQLATDVQSSLTNNGTQLATDVQSSLTNNGTQLATDVQSSLTNNGTQSATTNAQSSNTATELATTNVELPNTNNATSKTSRSIGQGVATSNYGVSMAKGKKRILKSTHEGKILMRPGKNGTSMVTDQTEGGLNVPGSRQSHVVLECLNELDDVRSFAQNFLVS